MKCYYVRQYVQSKMIVFKVELAMEEYDPAYYEEGNMGTDGHPEKAVIDYHIMEEE